MSSAVSPLILIRQYFFRLFHIETNFDLDLKEAIEDAPPLSLSTPDLHDISHHNPFQPLRRSASSSELLYEKVYDADYFVGRKIQFRIRFYRLICLIVGNAALLSSSRVG